MAYQISSSIVNVDVSFMSKTVQLPPASTVVGKMFLVHDLIGTTGSNVITVSTTGVDTIDYNAFTLELATPYESVRLIAQNTSNYSILMRAFNFNWSP